MKKSDSKADPTTARALVRGFMVILTYHPGAVRMPRVLFRSNLVTRFKNIEVEEFTLRLPFFVYSGRLQFTAHS